MTAELLSTTLSMLINNSFKYNSFPSKAKVTCVKPLDKKIEDKHCISKFQPVSILNILKIYEKLAKTFLVCDVEEFFSPFLAACRKSYVLDMCLLIAKLSSYTLHKSCPYTER